MLQNCAIDALTDPMTVFSASVSPAQRRIHLALWVLGLVLLLPACAGVDTWQREKIYRPTALQNDAEKQALQAANPEVGLMRVPSGAAGEWVEVLQVPALGSPSRDIRVLYLHGTFRHAYQNLPKTLPMRRAGMAVWLPDYRGWGGSSPRLPDEPGIHDDAWVVWQFLQAQGPRDPSVRWVIYGHSMGTAVATRLAARLKGTNGYCALVLESGFTSFSDLAQGSVGWVGRALVGMGSQRMAASEDITGVHGPVWFLHGSQDTTVPMAQGRRLYDMAPPPKFWRDWPLGHSNLHTDATGSYDQAWRDIATSCL